MPHSTQETWGWVREGACTMWRMCLIQVDSTWDLWNPFLTWGEKEALTLPLSASLVFLLFPLIFLPPFHPIIPFLPFNLGLLTRMFSLTTSHSPHPWNDNKLLSPLPVLDFFVMPPSIFTYANIPKTHFHTTVRFKGLLGVEYRRSLPLARCSSKQWPSFHH